MPKLKVLITHAVPVNNGDTALLLALYSSLIKQGYEVKIATFYYSFVKDRYPDLPFIKELTDYYFLRKLPFLKGVFMRLNFLFNKSYRENDLFIACPGGYVNSYYQLKYALMPLRLAKKNGAKTAIYSQSIGPFNSVDEKLFTQASNFLDVVLVRDAYSEDIIKKINYSGKYLRTKDAGFLLTQVPSQELKTTKVAVSVRAWGHDQRDMQKYIDLVLTLCLKVLSVGYSVEFLSTCQGVKGYKDDAKLAYEIKQGLLKENPQYESRVTVFSKYLTLKELMEKLQGYSFVVGTRLHMCILAWVNKVPAFNISYEIKGLECYRYLGVPAYSVDFNADTERAERQLTIFILAVESGQEQVFDKVELIHQEVKQDFQNFITLLDEVI